jgi:hypothetical protein
MSSAAGSSSTDHHDSNRPIAAITTRNSTLWMPHRMSAQPSSPNATSRTLSGVATMVSKVLA